jgi:hypothetical protein
VPTASDLLLTVTDLPVKDITIVRADDKVINITWIYCSTRQPYDWTGWSFSAKVKSAVDGTLWSTGIVTHDGTGGKITVLFPRAETAVLVPDAEGKWDLQGTDPSSLVRTIMRGDVLVVGDIT